MGRRRTFLDKRLANQISTRRRNSQQKNMERDRRRAQMIELLKEGEYPYTSTVRSWLSGELGKKASLITPEDIKPLIA